ncbi:integrase core domain-containing protein [Olsenella sp. Marseille-P4559]|uniref:integrase core domain-containing protein n=1 Tax=Olsenella sp. Marseille-P4559 TaxID=2364795 RepID=UPI001032383B|nr:integrase core domain-containing protein [Olsenella sp. Marseille-P4559]
MNQAVGMESPDGGLTFHNGQGIRYTPAVCQRCLRGHGMTQPVSRPGNPHDNAVAESFFGTLKHELVNGRRCGRGEEASQDTFKHIELYYNTRRVHSFLGYRPPAEFEREGA